MYSTHDLPAYALFVGWCVHGRFPCPTCKGALEFRWLTAGHKYSCFDLHRQFLDPRHKLRKDKKNFMKGRVVKHSAPPALTGQQTLDQINALDQIQSVQGISRGIIRNTHGLTRHASGICLTSKTSFAHTTST